MHRSLVLFFFCFGFQILQAQLRDTASLQLFPVLREHTFYIDSLKAFQLKVQVRTDFPTGAEYHWQARILSRGLSGQVQSSKQGGVISLRQDSTFLFQLTVADSADLYSVYVYLLERDFILDQLVWHVSDQPIPKANPIVESTRVQAQKPLVVKLAPDGFDLGGLVFNETKTLFGREFFSIFSQNWRPPTQTEAYWISIKEYPSQGRFTLISVSLNNRELFQRFLIPRRREMEDLAVDTIQLLHDLLSQGEIDGLFSDQDLHGNLDEHNTEIEKF